MILNRHPAGWPTVQAFVGKLAGLSGALAIILHMAADPPANAARDIDGQRPRMSATSCSISSCRTRSNFTEPRREPTAPASACEAARKLDSTLNDQTMNQSRRDITTNIGDCRGLSRYARPQHNRSRR